MTEGQSATEEDDAPFEWDEESIVASVINSFNSSGLRLLDCRLDVIPSPCKNWQQIT